MKKWLVSILILLLVMLACVYIFIPGKLTVTKITVIKCNTNATYRYLSDSNKWKMWWPSGNNRIVPHNADNSFANKKCTYRIIEKFYNSIQVSIKYAEDSSIKSRVNMIPLLSDSVALEWKYSIAPSWNPIKRIAQYNKASKIRRNMTEVMASLKLFLDKIENVYGIKIKRISTSDTLLVATKSVYRVYPSTLDIYRLINNLKNYIKSQNANVTGTPIMNVQQIDSMQFKLMVAVPTNKVLKDEGNIFFMRMIPGHFMSAEVKGGNYIVNHAFSQLQTYMADYKRTVMAIPFEALITDRAIEPDTSKWITRIYQPTF